MTRTTLAACLLAACLAPSGYADDPAMDVFEQRIMPIFRSPKPSSCIQCHLASIDLKDYIRPSHEETFLSLRDQGLIDVDQPDQSKILKLIRMGEEDQDSMARRIHEKARNAEYEAFTAWVHACCKDEALVGRSPLTSQELAESSIPDVQVIRHARKDRVLDSFVRNVWSQRMRCFPCHTPHEIDSNNPQHVKPKQRHAEFVKTWGAKMNLFKETPEATLRSMIAASKKSSKKRLPLINLEDPTQSLFVLKPTAKVPAKDADGKFAKPSAVTPVSHMGGLKMHKDDVSYKAVIAWIEDLAAITHNRYASAGEIPRDNWYPTNHVLRMKETPNAWPVGTRVQFFVHAAVDGEDHFSATPIAFTQGIVTPRHFANGVLVMLRPSDSAVESSWEASGVTIPPGKYMVKAYIDQEHLLDSNPLAMLGESDYRGQMVIDAEWNEGFKNAELVSGQQLSE